MACASFRAQTVLRGVVASCYQYYHKVPQLRATQSGLLDQVCASYKMQYVVYVVYVVYVFTGKDSITCTHYEDFEKSFAQQDKPEIQVTVDDSAA